MDAPFAANREYSACARMLMTEADFFRSQWKAASCFMTRFVSPRLGTFSGLRSSRSVTTSLKATVIPPPVSGCRMLRASPRITRPGVLGAAAGRKEFGMERSWPCSKAAMKAGWTGSGSEGRTTFRMWFFTPPFLTDAEGRFSGMSTRMRVSWVPIWYRRIGALSPSKT